MTDKQVICEKKIGDVTEVAITLGLSTQNVNNILNRPKSKHYKKVMGGLRWLIRERESRLERLKEFMSKL